MYSIYIKFLFNYLKKVSKSCRLKELRNFQPLKDFKKKKRKTFVRLSLQFLKAFVISIRLYIINSERLSISWSLTIGSEPSWPYSDRGIPNLSLSTFQLTDSRPPVECWQNLRSRVFWRGNGTINRMPVVDYRPYFPVLY